MALYFSFLNFHSCPSLTYISYVNASANTNMNSSELCCVLVHELKCMRLHCIYLIRFRNADMAWMLYGNLKPLNLQHPNSLSFPGAFALSTYSPVLRAIRIKYTHSYRTCSFDLLLANVWYAHMEYAGKLWETQMLRFHSLALSFSHCFVDALLYIFDSHMLCIWVEKRRKISNQH